MVKFKQLKENAVLPTRANAWDAGLDLTATSKEVLPEYIEYGTGVAVEIPTGHVGLLFCRSSVSKKGLVLANAVGVIDSFFTGEIKLRFKDIDRTLDTYEVGDRVGQLVIVPIVTGDAYWCDTLAESKRGSNGFGSSGV